MRYLIPILVIVTCLQNSFAEESTNGRLVIIGGGLRSDNSTVYERVIRHAGGKEQARFGIFPTASKGIAGATKFARNLEARGVTRDRIQIIDISVENAPQQASNPAVVEQIANCTGLFFAGGNQHRITQALLMSDGTETPALTAIRAMWKRGGVISGSSAGAAVQGDPMIMVSGLPDDSLDDGMDALDFGRTSELSRRGILVTRGLGFFRGGLIDQHFSEYRGRLGRLARVAIEERVRFGFGIDENTALDVAPDGTIEVIGAGHLTIVDAADAKCEDGPLGCRIANVRLTCLANGDRFDPRSGTATVLPIKAPIVAGAEQYNGNNPIPDISGSRAVLQALFRGLADNTSRKQIGLSLRFNQNFSHGYRFTFRETDQTSCYSGEVSGEHSYSIVGVNLNIDPVVVSNSPPQTVLPLDLPNGPARKAIEALFYRGILLADEHRRIQPDAPILRADLANAIVQTIHLSPRRHDPPRIADITADSPCADEIALVVTAHLMETDAEGAFRATDPVTRQEAATTLVRLAEMIGEKRLSCEPMTFEDESSMSAADREPAFAAVRSGLLTIAGERFCPGDPLTRGQAAAALYKIIGFPW